MKEPKFEAKAESSKIAPDSPKWKAFIQWCEANLVGKKIEASGYNFMPPRPLYRATITRFSVEDYEGGPQFSFGLNDGPNGDMEKFNEETKKWEPCTDVHLAIQGKITGGAELDGDSLEIGNGRVLSVEVPKDFFQA